AGRTVGGEADSADHRNTVPLAPTANTGIAAVHPRLWIGSGPLRSRLDRRHSAWDRALAVRERCLIDARSSMPCDWGFRVAPGRLSPTCLRASLKHPAAC